MLANKAKKWYTNFVSASMEMSVVAGGPLMGGTSGIPGSYPVNSPLFLLSLRVCYTVIRKRKKDSGNRKTRITEHRATGFATDKCQFYFAQNPAFHEWIGQEMRWMFLVTEG